MALHCTQTESYNRLQHSFGTLGQALEHGTKYTRTAPLNMLIVRSSYTRLDCREVSSVSTAYAALGWMDVQPSIAHAHNPGQPGQVHRARAALLRCAKENIRSETEHWQRLSFRPSSIRGGSNRGSTTSLALPKLLSTRSSIRT